MQDIAQRINKLRINPAGVKFNDLVKVYSFLFGKARQDATSHKVYATPWPGDPRINIQRGKNGMAKIYQVKQVIAAIDKLERMENE
jgi:hypothetical protein